MAAGASFFLAHKTSGEAAAIPPLPLRVVDPLTKIEPDDYIRRAVPLRLRFRPERRQRNRKAPVAQQATVRAAAPRGMPNELAK